MAASLGNASVQLEDISDTDDDDEALCLIAQCANTASITADTNVGGIAGNVSLDISFDREDQLNISSTLIGSGKYEIFARISSCENSASVAASKSCAGGIAGRMDYGLAVGCSALGEVTTAEEYAGGIVGHSSAAVRNCRARVNLSGKRYVGGIAGLGRTSRAASCRTLRIARSSAAPWRAMPTVRSPKISIPTPRSAVWTASVSPVSRTIWTMGILRPFRTHRTFSAASE